MTIAKNIVLTKTDVREGKHAVVALKREVSLQDVLDGLNAKQRAYYEERFPTLVEINAHTVLVVEHVGQKYIKIIATRPDGGQRSVYCFVDYAGNIYKAASWKAPAKHIRGSVFDPDFGWGKALGPYGAAYLR